MLKQVYPFCRWEDWGWVRRRYLLKAVRYVSGDTETESQGSRLSDPWPQGSLLTVTERAIAKSCRLDGVEGGKTNSAPWSGHPHLPSSAPNLPELYCTSHCWLLPLMDGRCHLPPSGPTSQALTQAGLP